MTKKETREAVRMKYGGRCAYCGCELGKGWHVSKILSESPIVDGEGNFVRPNDTFDNKIPSCAACNMSRTRDNSGVEFQTIEQFRQQLYCNLEFIQSFPYYQRAVRFGMITENKEPIKFYFEKLNQNT